MPKLIVALTIALFIGNQNSYLAMAQAPEGLNKQFNKLRQTATSEIEWERWNKHIIPDESEMAWAKTPWLPTFSEGLIKAGQDKKPVLLWTMNGHPLGCT